MQIKVEKSNSPVKQLLLVVLISSIIFNLKTFSQIKPEFVISDSASAGDMVIDDNNNFHVVLERRNDIIYRKYDSSFNPISEFKAFNNTTETSSSKIAIRNNYMVTVWSDLKLIMFYNSEIAGNISALIDELNPINFFVNEEYYDALRGSPDVCFISDTTFIVTWSGNGPRTIANSGIYGRIFSVIGEPLTSDILIIDRYNDTTRAILSKNLYCKKSDKLFITWVSNYFNKYRLWGRLFYPDGTPVDSSFAISEGSFIDDLFYYDTAIDSNGNFAAVWAIAKDSLYWELQRRWYDPNGNPITPIETISTPEDNVSEYSYVNFTIDKEGKSVLVWSNYRENKTKKYAKRFSSDGNQIGNAFRISQNDSTSETRSIFLLNEDNIFCMWSARSNKWYGTLGNILDFNNPTSVAENENTNVYPTTFNILQNYPNPFNSATKIKYTILSDTKVYIPNIKLKIYDILGNEIATLVDKKQAPGEYEIEFNSDNLFTGGQGLPSGVYIYVLQGGDLTRANKMILLK